MWIFAETINRQFQGNNFSHILRNYFLYLSNSVLKISFINHANSEYEKINKDYRFLKNSFYKILNLLKILYLNKKENESI